MLAAGAVSSWRCATHTCSSWRVRSQSHVSKMSFVFSRWLSCIFGRCWGSMSRFVLSSASWQKWPLRFASSCLGETHPKITLPKFSHVQCLMPAQCRHGDVPRTRALVGACVLRAMFPRWVSWFRFGFRVSLVAVGEAPYALHFPQQRASL